MHCVVPVRFLWYSALLLLLHISPSHQESFEDVVTAMEQLKTLIETRFTEVEAEMNNIKTEIRALKLGNLEESLCNIGIEENTAESTQLLFDPHKVVMMFGESVELGCGVAGPFQSCSWTHGNQTYQLDDVQNNVYPNFEVAISSIINQCSISVKMLDETHTGEWECRVLTKSGNSLTASKTLSVTPLTQCSGEFFRLGSECFSIVTKKVSWQKARAACREKGADLATPKSIPDLQDYLNHDEMSDSNYWVGGSDFETEGSFTWLDGAKVNNGWWRPGQPNADGDCVFLYTDGLYDSMCTNNNRFICER